MTHQREPRTSKLRTRCEDLTICCSTCCPAVLVLINLKQEHLEKSFSAQRCCLASNLNLCLHAFQAAAHCGSTSEHEDTEHGFVCLALNDGRLDSAGYHMSISVGSTLHERQHYCSDCLCCRAIYAEHCFGLCQNSSMRDFYSVCNAPLSCGC